MSLRTRIGIGLVCLIAIALLASVEWSPASASKLGQTVPTATLTATPVTETPTATPSVTSSPTATGTVPAPTGSPTHSGPASTPTPQLPSLLPVAGASGGTLLEALLLPSVVLLLAGSWLKIAHRRKRRTLR